MTIDREKVLRGLKCCTSTNYTCRDDCPYDSEIDCKDSLIEDALELVKGQSAIINEYIESLWLRKCDYDRQIQAYQQLLEWAVECGFGYDNIPELYEQHKDEIERMSYTDGLLYLALRSLEKGKSNV